MDDDGGQPGEVTRRGFLTQVGAATVVSTLAPLGVSAIQPGGASARQRTSFDSGWKFLRDDVEHAQDPRFDDSEWRQLDLPHDWSIEGPFDQKERAQGSLPTGIGWYRKIFQAPEAHRGDLFTIEFDGVYENSTVWLNGVLLGTRPSGYTPFYYDLTPSLVRRGDNVVAVRVDNSKQPNCRWYSGSGIYRHTWLVSTDRIHVAPWGVFVSTPEVSTDRGVVHVKTWVRNDGTDRAQCTITSAILDAAGATLQSVETSQSIAGKDTSDFIQHLSIDAPRLWSHESPQLYTLRTTIRSGERVVDEVDTSFGIRTAEFDSSRGFLLNGKRVKLNGVCLHHEAGCVGAAVPERVWERRLATLKEMGCNAIRTSHNPPASEFLDLCDRMGFMVMAEAFDEWRHGKGQIGPFGYARYFDRWFEKDVENFVRRDRNHPSIVLWSAGNEIGDQSAPEGAKTLRRLQNVFRREDPTRLVTCGCDQIASEPLRNRVRPEFLDALDVVGYNYVDRWRDRVEKYYAADREAHPTWRVIGTESGSMGSTRGDYRYLTEAGPGSFFRNSRGRMIDVEQLWKFVRLHDFVAGDFMWTGIDYLGESRWPGKGASSGVIDMCGFKKDGFYFYQSQWTAEPVLYLFPHWNWPGKEGQFMPVFCYTNCDSVELFLNGKSIGAKGYAFPRVGMEERYGNYPARARALRTTADLHLEWDVPYEPGALRAVGTKDGKEIKVVEVSTTGPAARVSLSVDRSPIAAGSRDVAHIAVEIVDDHGRVVPDAGNELHFGVSGAGTLIGLDNGDPMSHEDYRSNRRRAFHGMALAIVRSTATPGSIDVKVTAPGLRPAELTIVSA